MSHTGTGALDTGRFHLQKFGLLHAPAHSSPPTAPQQQLLPTEVKCLDHSDLLFFLFFSASYAAEFQCVQCHNPISMKILVASEGFKISKTSKTHFLLYIPVGITWEIIIWPYIYTYIYIHLYPIILYSKQLPWGTRNHIKMHAN